MTSSINVLKTCPFFSFLSPIDVDKPVFAISASPSPLSHLTGQQHALFQAHVDFFAGEDVGPQFVSLPSNNYSPVNSNMVEQFRDDVRNQPGERSTRDNITCTKKWAAAKSMEEDKISVFEQTGIFILACRHGFVECITEMKRSGELTKYGLAAVSRLLEVCGQDQGLGHDIGCSSRKTIAASSIGNLATRLNLVVAVNAFHGYAHNCPVPAAPSSTLPPRLR
ncbi:uncharacterized protein EDB91DRAFT_1255303 [Suillus paluster]|uniref:uncharacterized protein n=1 Tax=Suillus paluster TaxID=48578 RepID=UPI001B87EC27|nr:uncharacterized protein EDB91DRAFT_1255303 [Suillus paluster]KAG1724290.1 hypothetical protein EDB91DRAFT_1255303 [Suillus paluster]